jgi:hypothetical protein
LRGELRRRWKSSWLKGAKVAKRRKKLRPRRPIAQGGMSKSLSPKPGWINELLTLAVVRK